MYRQRTPFVLSLADFKSFFNLSFRFLTSSSNWCCNSKTFCVNNLDLSPITDSYFSNKLLAHWLLFEMTYSSFLFQNTILGMTNSKTMSSGLWLCKICSSLKCMLFYLRNYVGVEIPLSVLPISLWGWSGVLKPGVWRLGVVDLQRCGGESCLVFSITNTKYCKRNCEL